MNIRHAILDSLYTLFIEQGPTAFAYADKLPSFRPGYEPYLNAMNRLLREGLIRGLAGEDANDGSTRVCVAINPERADDVRQELGPSPPHSRLDYRRFLQHIDSTIFDAVHSCCPASWDEDHITFSITDRLGRLKRTEITGLRRPITIEWDARKLRGRAETAFGDLGVLVRFTAWDGQRIEGLGLLEAKKRSLGSGAFDATRKSQLAGILESAPRAQLLLYDHSNVTDFADNLRFAAPEAHSVDEEPTAPIANAVTLPSHLSLALGKPDTSQYKFSVPLSVQLCSRYFRGLDLEFAQSALDRVKKHLDAAGGPRHLLIVTISTGGSSSEQFAQVNDERYPSIEHED